MANTLVSSDISTDLGNYGRGLWGPYYVSQQLGFEVHVNNALDIQAFRTTDGGVTWNQFTIHTGTVDQIAVWFDRETPGDNGTEVHICWLDSANSSFQYRSFDIFNTSQSGTITIQGSLTISTNPTLIRCAITKTRSGDLIAACETQSDLVCERSTDGGDNWSPIDDPYEFASQEDQVLLFPANTGDDNDAAALFLDRSANILSVKIYDQSGDTWTNETNLDTSIVDDATYFAFEGAIRASDGHLLVVSHDGTPGTTHNFHSYDVTLTLTPSVTGKGDIFTSQSESGLGGMVIDQTSDDVYVAYAKGGTWETSVDIVYHKSTDGMGSWGSEQAYSEGAASNYRSIGSPRTVTANGGIVQWTFHDQSSDVYVNLVNDVPIAATPADAVGGLWKLINGDGSHYREHGDTGYLTLGGNEMSATEADVQTKIYEDYLFKSMVFRIGTLGDTTYALAFRDDGSTSTNLTVTPTATGWDDDLLGSELALDNSLCNLIIDGSAAMHSDQITVRQNTISIENPSVLEPIWCGGLGGGTQSADHYALPGTSKDATEAWWQVLVKRSVTYSNFRIIPTVVTGTWDVAVTKDGITSTNLAITVTSTGAVEDIVGTEAFVEDELFGVEMVETVAGTLDILAAQVNPDTLSDWKHTQDPHTAGTTRVYSGWNRMTWESGQSNTTPQEMRIGEVEAGNLQAYIQSISTTGDGNVYIEGVQGSNLTLAFTGTGRFEDTVGTEIIGDTNGFACSAIADSGTVEVTHMACECPHVPPAAVVNPLIRPLVVNQAINRASVI